MAKSQNGWSVISRSGCVNLRDANGWPIPVRKGDVAVIFKELMDWFHKEIEPLRNGWSWGFAPRKVRGGSSISNHASGTAVDFNAPLHPLGKRNTFKSSQRDKIRKKAKELGLRWGGDYKSRADDMHFEIIVSGAKVKEIAKRIKGKKAPAKKPAPAKSSAKWATRLYPGKNSTESNKRWQRILNKWYPKLKPLAVDGIYGPATTDRTRYFQKMNRLKVTGIADQGTLRKVGW